VYTNESYYIIGTHQIYIKNQQIVSINFAF